MKCQCGIKSISNLGLPVNISICLISFAASFSSLSVIFQLYAISHNLNINLLNLIIYKGINGIFSALISYCLITVTPFSTYVHSTKNVFLNNDLFDKLNTYMFHQSSIINFSISILFIFLVVSFIIFIEKVTKNSHLIERE